MYQKLEKYCPDYEIIEWNEDNFDINIHPYTKYCYENKKWAFLSDYVRLWVVENMVVCILIQMWK